VGGSLKEGTTTSSKLTGKNARIQTLEGGGDARSPTPHKKSARKNDQGPKSKNKLNTAALNGYLFSIGTGKGAEHFFETKKGKRKKNSSGTASERREKKEKPEKKTKQPPFPQQEEMVPESG